MAVVDILGDGLRIPQCDKADRGHTARERGGEGGAGPEAVIEVRAAGFGLNRETLMSQCSRQRQHPGISSGQSQPGRGSPPPGAPTVPFCE